MPPKEGEIREFAHAPCPKCNKRTLLVLLDPKAIITCPEEGCRYRFIPTLKGEILIITEVAWGAHILPNPSDEGEYNGDDPEQTDGV